MKYVGMWWWLVYLFVLLCVFGLLLKDLYMVFVDVMWCLSVIIVWVL